MTRELRPIRTGDKLPGVECRKCRSLLAIRSALALLPDEFLGSCPECGHTAVYQKSEIETLVACTKH